MFAKLTIICVSVSGIIYTSFVLSFFLFRGFVKWVFAKLLVEYGGKNGFLRVWRWKEKRVRVQLVGVCEFCNGTRVCE